MRQVVLDTETTGLETAQGHRIIEIGGVELVNRRYTGRQLHKYINPEREIDDGAFEVHGISSEFLADKPKFAEIADEIVTCVNAIENYDKMTKGSWSVQNFLDVEEVEDDEGNVTEVKSLPSLERLQELLNELKAK